MDSNPTQASRKLYQVSNLKCMLCANRRISAGLSTATFFGNPTTALQSLEAAIQELAAPILITKGKDTSYGFADKSMLEERVATKIWSTESYL